MPERGKTGDHGQGGAPGGLGPVGPMGPAYSSWLTRNVVKAYLILAVGVVAAFLTMGFVFDNVVDRINRGALIDCKAGNDRSDLQKEDLLESLKQIESIDIRRLFGIDEQQASEFRRLSRETTQKRMDRLPYIDCATGKQVRPTTANP